MSLSRTVAGCACFESAPRMKDHAPYTGARAVFAPATDAQLSRLGGTSVNRELVFHQMGWTDESGYGTVTQSGHAVGVVVGSDSNGVPKWAQTQQLKSLPQGSFVIAGVVRQPVLVGTRCYWYGSTDIDLRETHSDCGYYKQFSKWIWLNKNDLFLGPPNTTLVRLGVMPSIATARTPKPSGTVVRMPSLTF